MRYEIDSLCVYDLRRDPVLHAMKALLKSDSSEDMIENWALFFKELCKAGSADNLKGYIAGLVLTDDNCFSRRAAAGEIDKLSDTIKAAVKQDLATLEKLAHFQPEDILKGVRDPEIKSLLAHMGQWKTGGCGSLLAEHWGERLEELQAYHQKHGYGKFAKYKAFAWRDHQLFPITSSNPITLNDLKSYERQRQKVVDNTESFVMGLPANNVLLYGDRGTGKSSTVHAVLNQFAGQGLRMIEVPKSAIPEFPVLLEQLVDAPMKFIIFIDDLSFSSDDDSYASLKAALEGSVSARQSNTLIYATSNRRHLIKESFSSREGDELHRVDTIQETMSLSDRFGLSVTFLNPDCARFYEIIDQIVADRGLNIDLKRLHAGAERWALERGGRSPRVAKQYIDMIESKIKRGFDW